MIFASFFPYLQRQDSFSQADLNGAWRAHHDLLRSALSHGVVQKAHLFVSGPTPNGELPMHAPEGAALRELRREFGEERIQLKNAAELPIAAAQSKYIFVEKAPTLYRLAHARLAVGRGAYPICSLVNSVCFRDLLNSFVGLLTSAEPQDALVVTSEAGLKAVREGLVQAEEFLRDRSPSIASDTVRLVKIPLAVEEGTFGQLDKSCCRRVLNLPIQSTVLLYVGRFSDEYKADLEPLLLAFHQLSGACPNLLLLLAGQDVEGQYSRRVVHFADDFGLGHRVKVLVNFPPALKPVLYSAGDIFVSPADNIEETFGLVILEAMASGLPVVCSDWSGYRDCVVHGQTGFLVRTLWNESAAEVLSWLAPTSKDPIPEGYLAHRTVVDVTSLIQYVRTLIENDELRKRFGAAGRERVAHFFAWTKIIEKYKELWTEQIQIAKGQQKACGPPASLDFNRMFGHYASNRIGFSTAVRCSEIGRSLATRKNHTSAAFESAGFNDEFLTEVFRILDSCTRPTTVQAIVAEGSSYSYEAVVWLLKKGFCELTDEAHRP